MAGAQRKDGDANEIEQNRGHVHHVVGPIAPAGQKTVEVAEDFLGPKVDAAFAGITGGKFDDRDTLRGKKEQQGNDPKPNGYAAVRRNGRNHVQVEHGNHEQQQQIALTENAFEMRLGFRGVHFLCQRFSPKALRGITRMHRLKRPDSSQCSAVRIRTPAQVVSGPLRR